MSDPYREPRPSSPERLSLFSLEYAKHEDYMVKLSATFLFNPFTPDWEGDLPRAVTVLAKVVADAADNAKRKRERKGAAQYEGLVVGECECGCGSHSEGIVIPTSIQGEDNE